MTSLSVNLNKIALLRNSREGDFPSVVKHGKICLESGCDGLTIHPRPDQRHIRPHDAHDLKALLEDWPGREFNIEGNPFAEPLADYPGFLPLVLATVPDQCTLVPDANHQLTSDHGFDLKQSAGKLEPVIRQLQDAGIRVSLFMDPDIEQIRLAKAIGADRIELYTGPYAASWPDKAALQELFPRYFNAAEEAQKLGLGLNAGHDLNLENLGFFLQVPGLLEVSIGHALVADALLTGLAETVRAYKNILSGRL